ncbi:MAG: Mpo1-like protein [Polyangiales bacterium]
MSEKRFESFEEFWPFYLSEHQNATSRRLHFLGTGGFLAATAASAVMNPVGFGAAMAGFGLVMRDAMKAEEKGPAFKHVAAMVAMPTAASPVLFPAGIVWAYGCAWVGHFLIENNRPATFKQPVWSLFADMRMFKAMASGKLWSGTNPREQMGFDVSDVNVRDVPEVRVYS